MAAGHVKFHETADLKFIKLVLKNLREFIHNPVGKTCLKTMRGPFNNGFVSIVTCIIIRDMKSVTYANNYL